MGCFTVLRGKKKKSDRPICIKNIRPQESTPAVLPEPQNISRSLQSAPSSFKNRLSQPAQTVQPVNQITYSRSRALSAPSSLNAAERDNLSSIEFDDLEDSVSFRYLTDHKNHVPLGKDYQSPSPQPLPLPSSQAANAVLQNMGSFKAGNASGPLPLPPLGVLRNFSYEEISAACQQFSAERCMSEGLSSIIYKASFGDDSSGSKKLEATVTRLLPTSQVTDPFPLSMYHCGCLFSIILTSHFEVDC